MTLTLELWWPMRSEWRATRPHVSVPEAKWDRTTTIDAYHSPTLFRAILDHHHHPLRTADRHTLAQLAPTLRVSASASGDFPLDADSSECAVALMPTLRFCAQLRDASPHLYAHGQPLPASVDAPNLDLLRNVSVARASLWISAAGARSPLHYDLPHVLLCQMQGRKRVHLFPPHLHDAMDVRGETFPALAATERVARTRRATLPRCECVVAELLPGDALFIPSGWFHEVESVDDGGCLRRGVGCVSVGLNWPCVGEALPLLAPHARWTRRRILTQGEVLARHIGEAAARAHPDAHLPVFANA